MTTPAAEKSSRPVLLLMTGAPEPYQKALAAAGLNEAFDVILAAGDKLPPADVLQRTEAMLALHPPAGMLTQMPRLRWIQSLTAGVDQWLARGDLPAGLMLTAARGTHRLQMPENILGALFHLTKPFMASRLDQKERRWTRRTSDTLAGKTLAILGLGAIGQELARKAAALEMRVIGVRRTVGDVPFVEKVVPLEQVEEVLSESDYVVLLLPVTAATTDLMNHRRLARMRKDAYLLNYGRGQLIVDLDLVAAVNSGVIAGAVLDVFRTEPLPTDHPFWTTERITVLPHFGGLHKERDQLVARLLVENAQRLLAGQTLKELVDRARGY